jgi:autotransporter translocation and assembly factor TamB
MNSPVHAHNIRIKLSSCRYTENTERRVVASGGLGLALEGQKIAVDWVAFVGVRLFDILCLINVLQVLVIDLLGGGYE